MLTLFSNRRFQFVLSIFAVILVTPVVANAFALELGVAIMQIFARITGWAGILLNISIMELVFNMGNILSTRIGVSVENAWSVIRDIMNLLFIFSLIYIGFLVILDASSSHARRLLPPLIIAALLVNFSLFFTKAIIDVTNIAATEIYMTTIGNPLSSSSNTSGPGQVTEALINVGISGAFMQSLGLKDLLSPNQAAGNSNNISYQVKLSEACHGNTDGQCSVDILVYFLLSILFFLIAAYAFAVGAFMLAWRFIVLIFLLIFSPLMFAGMIFPKAAAFQRRWWGTFLNAAFFAPAYMLMLYIAYSIASRIQVFNQNDAMFYAVSGSYTSVDLILNFVLVIGFLLGATWVSREMSFYGSKGTVKLVENIRRRGQRVVAAGTVGAAAWGLRNSAGKAAQSATENERRVQLAQGKGMRAWVARRQLDAAKGLASSSFDVRQSLGKGAQKQVGTGYKGGYAQKIKDREKADKERAKLYGSNDKAVFADYGVETQLKKYQEYEKARTKAEQELANPKTDKKRRLELIKEIKTNTSLIKDMDKGIVRNADGKVVNRALAEAEYKDYLKKGGDNSVTQKEFVDDFMAQYKEQTDEAAQFAAAKKAEKGYGARRWATNRETAWTESGVHKFVGGVFTDSKARKAGAKAVKKANAQKTADQKLKDAIKELNPEEAKSSPETPAASDSGNSGGGNNQTT